MREHTADAPERRTVVQRLQLMWHNRSNACLPVLLTLLAVFIMQGPASEASATLAHQGPDATADQLSTAAWPPDYCAAYEAEAFLNNTPITHDADYGVAGHCATIRAQEFSELLWKYNVDTLTANISDTATRIAYREDKPIGTEVAYFRAYYGTRQIVNQFIPPICIMTARDGELITVELTFYNHPETLERRPEITTRRPTVSGQIAYRGLVDAGFVSKCM